MIFKGASSGLSGLVDALSVLWTGIYGATAWVGIVGFPLLSDGVATGRTGLQKSLRAIPLRILSPKWQHGGDSAVTGRHHIGGSLWTAGIGAVWSDFMELGVLLDAPASFDAMG